MGRLPALILVGLLAGCEERPEPSLAPKARSQGVVATADAVPAAPRVQPSAPEANKPTKARAQLCSHEASGDPFPDQALARVEGELGRSNLKPKTGGGHWTWVNLWAAWCAPCKEELPRLMAWQKSLGFRLHTISIDDDERQLRNFLSSSSAPLQASFWLPEGAPREQWLKAVGVEADPELPMQLLFDPKGKLRCMIQGAVEPSDLARVTELVH